MCYAERCMESCCTGTGNQTTTLQKPLLHVSSLHRSEDKDISNSLRTKIIEVLGLSQVKLSQTQNFNYLAWRGYVSVPLTVRNGSYLVLLLLLLTVMFKNVVSKDAKLQTSKTIPLYMPSYIPGLIICQVSLQRGTYLQHQPSSFCSSTRLRNVLKQFIAPNSF